jgi:hypothetical protein
MLMLLCYAPQEAGSKLGSGRESPRPKASNPKLHTHTANNPTTENPTTNKQQGNKQPRDQQQASTPHSSGKEVAE